MYRFVFVSVADIGGWIGKLMAGVLLVATFCGLCIVLFMYFGLMSMCIGVFGSLIFLYHVVGWCLKLGCECMWR